MKISTIQSFNYNQNSLNSRQQQSKLAVNNQLPQPAFKGGKGAGVGSALGTAAVAWLGAGALIAAGPLAIAAGLLAGCAGGGAGHGIEKLTDKK